MNTNQVLHSPTGRLAPAIVLAWGEATRFPPGTAVRPSICVASKVLQKLSFSKLLNPN